MTTRGRFVHNPMVKLLREHPENVGSFCGVFVCKFLLKKYMVSKTKQIHKGFRIKGYFINKTQLENFYIFLTIHYLPKLYIEL